MGACRYNRGAMGISAGTRIGPFEVLGLVGKGGMGAVYRAHDTRLRRDVAIKVLPSAFSDDADRLRRFEQEALAVARLEHPNILAVHDVGTHDGAPYFVTELLEGETLGQKMNGRPLPKRRAVEFAVQIARGLAAAHDRGIVHRDIKPDNLFITRDGHVKILDFGLAKLTDVDTAADASMVTVTVLGVGPVIGTAAYMAPEQAAGLAADHRADIFSFGVVLYEMLSGTSPFRRGTTAETLTAILREDPPPLDGSISGPPDLSRLLGHCLERPPAERFQSARDLVFALEALSDAASTSPAARRPGWSSRALALLAVCALVAAMAAGFLSGIRKASQEPTLAVPRVNRLTDFAGVEEFPAIAPDLKSVAFTAGVNGTRQIFVRLIAGGTPLQITKEPVDHEQPRWSPDASSLVYFSPAASGQIQGTIWEIPALGGAPRRVIDSVGGGDLNRDGRLVCFRLAGGRIELVTASRDGADVRVIARFPDAVYHKYPRWSPDARWIAYQRGDGVRWDVFAITTDGGTPRQLTHDNKQVHGLAWLPDSTGIVYSSSRESTMPYLPTLGLWEVDLQNGAPRRIVPADLSYLHPDIHASGTMVAARMQMQFDLWSYPADGSSDENVRRAKRITRQTGQVQTPTIGASDKEIAYLSDSGGHANLWVTATDTGALRQITYERDANVSLGVPIWSPDGRWIAFVSSRGSTGLGFGIWLVNPDGGNLRNAAKRGFGAAWSPESRWLYYVDAGILYKVPTTGGSAVRVRKGQTRNVIGHDGTTLYFMVDRTLIDRSPGFEIHAASPEDAPSRVLAHIPAPRAPQWQIINPALSPDGRRLALPLTDGFTTNIWTVSTSTGEWRRITEFGNRSTFIARRISWSSDGRSIIAAIGEGDADIVMLERN
jgi:serine/threonine protein kinase/Tol biopolymer transport system component